MSFPMGNQFWKARSSHGRKPTFASGEDLWNACVEYFEWVDANPLKEAQAFAYQGQVTVHELSKLRAMTIEHLCIFLDIERETWRLWRSSETLAVVVARVDEVIRTQKFQGAAAGLLNSSIIARDLGLADRAEVSGRDGAPLELTPEDPMKLARAVALMLAEGSNAIGKQRD